jgi:SRSO17 transposase
MTEDWRRELERWLEPYLAVRGNKTRRGMCPAYIAGLIDPGDRKSIQPMAARADAVSYDRLHHFIGAGLRGSAPLEQALWRQADTLLGGSKAWLIVDDTTLPKKGKASVGVAPQYATVLGKNANCQTLVSATAAYAGRGGMARGRASHQRRTEILSLQPPRRHGAARSDWGHQGPLDLRTGASATQGTTWPGPIRRPIVDRLHCHALMTMMAYAFLQTRGLAQAGRKKKSPRPAAATQPTSSAPITLLPK